MVDAADIDEAVVEEEPDDGRAHPGLLGDGLRHRRPHDGGHAGARLGVELGRELPMARKKQAEESEKSQTPGEQDTHFWPPTRHGSPPPAHCKLAHLDLAPRSGPGHVGVYIALDSS